MDRKTLEKRIAEVYQVKPEYPWASSPDFAVFRHGGNQKWFALIMNVTRAQLGLPEKEKGGKVDIVNLKCDPVMAGSFRTEPGIYPAYHMNKTHWLSVALDGSAKDEMIQFLLDRSFYLTAPKPKKSKKKDTEKT